MKYCFGVALLLLAAFLSSQPTPPERVGPLAAGGFLLNSGWRLQPAGTQVPLDTFPMASTLSKDGRYLLVLHGGYKTPTVLAYDTQDNREVSRVVTPDAWLGLSLSPDGKRVYVGGGATGAVHELSLSPQGELALIRSMPLAEPEKGTPSPSATPSPRDFIGDVTLSPDGRLLYAAALYRDQVVVVNPQSGFVIKRIKTGRRPYRLLFHPDGKSFFLSSWADGTVYQYESESGQPLGYLRLGPHTTDLLFLPKRTATGQDEGAASDRLFVTGSNTNKVWSLSVSEAKDLKLAETINVALTPLQPAGMTPSALAINADASRLFVVCSDANAVAVVDLSEARSRVLGFVPTGWYPTAARSLRDGRLIVLNGRGAASYPNPGGPNPTKRVAISHLGERSDQYVGQRQLGSASVIAPWDEEQLDTYTTTVKRNSPYRDALLVGADIAAGGPVPSRPGDATPIKHVIYVLKENRTYDQVLGDLKPGNGDPSLTLFGEEISPNHHQLARDFVLLDNFYVNADVSADGHNWSSSAIANDYVQKMWPNSYGRRRKTYDYEGGEVAALPPAGYLWTNAAAAKISMRNYGWWSTNKPRTASGDAPEGEQILNVRDPILAPVTDRNYRAFDLDYPDVSRAQEFIRELHQFEQQGSMPQLLLVRLGNDHTSGIQAGKISPLSAMADNDYALGMLVEAVSRSKFWPETAIFVLEDDAQNGPDHVDSHRSPAFVLSPYTRGRGVDSTMYNTTSMLRTIELILGLRPMTHFDAAARPLANAFRAQPDARPYEAQKPRRSLTERNPAGGPTAEQARMDFSEADQIDDDELNEVLWRAIRRSEPPAPVRSLFGR